MNILQLSFYKNEKQPPAPGLSSLLMKLVKVSHKLSKMLNLCGLYICNQLFFSSTYFNSLCICNELFYSSTYFNSLYICNELFSSSTYFNGLFALSYFLHHLILTLEVLMGLFLDLITNN